MEGKNIPCLKVDIKLCYHDNILFITVLSVLLIGFAIVLPVVMVLAGK